MLWTWDALILPVLAAIGERWADTGNGIDVEHLMAETVLGALRSVMVCGAGTATMLVPSLLASAPEELHTLPLHALAAALRRTGHRLQGAGGQRPWTRAGRGGSAWRSQRRVHLGSSS